MINISPRQLDVFVQVAVLGSVVLAHLGWSGVMGMATGAALLARVVARSAR